MTILTSLSITEKPQDSVESDAIRVISGENARRVVYVLYTIIIVTSSTILYLYTSTVVIYGFMVLMAVLMASLYPLVKFVIKTEDSDLVWDNDGLHWFRQSDVTVQEYGNYASDLYQSSKTSPTTSNYYLSYAFI